LRHNARCTVVSQLPPKILPRPANSLLRLA
jgi:hypothetical protein